MQTNVENKNANMLYTMVFYGVLMSHTTQKKPLTEALPLDCALLLSAPKAESFVLLAPVCVAWWSALLCDSVRPPIDCASQASVCLTLRCSSVGSSLFKNAIETRVLKHPTYCFRSTNDRGSPFTLLSCNEG